MPDRATAQVAAIIAAGFTPGDAARWVREAAAAVPEGADPRTWLPDPGAFALSAVIDEAAVQDARADWYVVAPLEYKLLLDDLGPPQEAVGLGEAVFYDPAQDVELGGPGSGNYGHAGRPGVGVGGSAPSRYATIGPEHQIVADGEESPQLVGPVADYAWVNDNIKISGSGMTHLGDADTLAWTIGHSGIPRRYLEGVQFSTDPPYGYRLAGNGSFLDPVDPLPNINGLYVPSTDTIHIAPASVNASDTVIHEVGHHVMYRQHDAREMRSLLNDKFDYRSMDIPRPLESGGLRNYSISNARELYADAFVVALRGSPSQQAALRKWLDMDWEALFAELGGPGSGNYGHAGRPGVGVGGSASDSTPSAIDSQRTVSGKAVKLSTSLGPVYIAKIGQTLPVQVTEKSYDFVATITRDATVISGRSFKGKSHDNLLASISTPEQAALRQTMEDEGIHVWRSVENGPLSPIQISTPWAIPVAAARKLQRKIDSEGMERTRTAAAWDTTARPAVAEAARRLIRAGFPPTTPFRWSLYSGRFIDATLGTISDEIGLSEAAFGGPGSGNYGHKGRPGEIGGSGPGLSFAPTAERVWTGKSQPAAGDLSKETTGALGEALAAHVLSQRFGARFETLNQGLNNAPLDVAGDHVAVEVKTGLASNGASAQHWRATIGEPGREEKAAMRGLTAAEKAEYNQIKQELVMERKADMLREMSTIIGGDMQGYTLGVILAPDGRRGDAWLIPGFHARIGWNQLARTYQDAYVGTWEIDREAQP